MTVYDEDTHELNLEYFCHPDREEICGPFSAGAHSYASNGHWLIRIPRRPDIADHTDKEFAQRFLKLVSDAGSPGKFQSLTVSLPEKTESECTECSGTGRKHYDCDTCCCDCVFCDGEGRRSTDTSLSIGIGSAAFAATYIRDLLTLSDFQIAPRPERQKGAPMWFHFHGGDGLLMPLRYESGTHIVAELS